MRRRASPNMANGSFPGLRGRQVDTDRLDCHRTRCDDVLVGELPMKIALATRRLALYLPS